jgi:hypothetical protein
MKATIGIKEVAITVAIRSKAVVFSMGYAKTSRVVRKI